MQRKQSKELRKKGVIAAAVVDCFELPRQHIHLVCMHVHMYKIFRLALYYAQQHLPALHVASRREKRISVKAVKMVIKLSASSEKA